MTDLFTRIRTAVRKRMEYERTYTQLARMPKDVARDVNLDPRDARKNAHRAVYGS